MRVLVTNDDGLLAPGLAPLARAVRDAGHTVVAIAPADDRSGAGASLGPLREPGRVPFEQVRLDGLGDVDAYAIDGPPALAVLLACRSAFGDAPELVVSGINPGMNTGRAIIHSGTVGAALTAGNLGRPALAVSIGWGDAPLWESACALATAALAWLIARPTEPRPPGPVLNLNVPNVPLTELQGVRSAPLAPFGTVRTAVTATGDRHLQLEFRETEWEIPPDTDTALVRAGYATVTALGGLVVADAGDAPDKLERALTKVSRRG